MKKTTVAVALCLALAVGEARAKSCSTSFVAENDLPLADRNYTTGILLSHSCAVTGKKKTDEIDTLPDRPWVAPLRVWNIGFLKAATDLFSIQACELENHVYSHYGGMSLFTPNELVEPKSKKDGRPYASLLVYGDNALQADESFSIKTELQVGLLGLGFGEPLQGAVHKALGGDDPKGWGSEISQGGEPVATAALQGKRLLCAPDGRGSCSNGPYDVTASLGGSVGSYTSMRLGVSGRLGIIDSPFWGDKGPIHQQTRVPYESVDVNGKSASANKGRNTDEIFFFASGGMDLVLYSAVLQGQFRESRYVVDSSDVERTVPSARLGIAGRLRTFRFSLSHSLRGPEIEGGKSHQWTSLSFGWVL